MGWRVLYISEGEYMNLYLDNIKIENSGKSKEILIPIKDIHTLILDNYKSVLTVQLMNYLTKSNVNVVICGIDHIPKSILLPIRGNVQAASILKKQISWRKTEKETAHKEIVKAKIHNQRCLLEFLNKDVQVIELLKKYENEVTNGDITNREGLAAKVYFRALFGKTFKRFESDVVNAGLNYGYSILRSQISKSIIAKGLNPSLGLFHRGPNNYFNLSDDLIEPFRPIVDFYVHNKLLKEVLFTKENKIDLVKNLTKNIYYKNLSQTVFNTIIQYIDSIISFIETGEVDNVEFHPIIKYEYL